MIEEIRLENYGPFRQAGLRLGQLTVLVGPNASGKSTLLEALHCLAEQSPGQPGWILKGRNRSASPNETTHVDVFSEGRKVGGAAFDPQFRLDPFENEDSVADGSRFQSTFLRLDPGRLREASYIPSASPEMKEDGYGLATALAGMKLADSGDFETVSDHLRRIVPTFEKLKIQRAKVRDSEAFGEELVFDMKNGPGLAPGQVSDGTLLTLGILTCLRQRLAARRQDQDFICLIDELERSLHPRALGELIGHLRQLAEDTDTQILATSHSPYLLDSLKADEVRLTGFLEDGTATIRELSEHPEFERWKDEMTPGEFWSMVGEEWVA